MPTPKSYIGFKSDATNSTVELEFTDSIFDGFDYNTWETTNLVQDTINKIKAASPKTIKMTINSMGGDVMIGLALYNYIKNYDAEVQVDVIGFAASIASIMAMAASPGKLKMAKTSFYIIHAASSVVIMGNADELKKTAAQLDKVSTELADIYALRSGKTAKYYTDLWANGDYWMSATDAKDLGLADELYNAEKMAAHADFSDFHFKNIPTALKPKNNAGENIGKEILSSLNNGFMNLKEMLTNLTSAGKKNEKFKDVPGKDAVMDMLNEVLAPLVDEVDKMKVAEVAPTTDKKDDTKKDEKITPIVQNDAAEKPKDDKKVEEKKDEAKKDEKVTEPTASAEEIKNLRDQVATLTALMAASKGKPQQEQTTKTGYKPRAKAYYMQEGDI